MLRLQTNVDKIKPRQQVCAVASGSSKLSTPQTLEDRKFVFYVWKHAQVWLWSTDESNCCVISSEQRLHLEGWVTECPALLFVQDT